jgi:hypothetical protein
MKWPSIVGASTGTATYVPPNARDALVKKMVDHALSSAYIGAPTQGDYYGGWPLEKLSRAVVAGLADSEYIKLELEFKKNMGLVGTHLRTRVLPTPPNPIDPVVNYTPVEMLSMRMRWDRNAYGKSHGGAFLHVDVYDAGTKVFVFIVTNDVSAVTLEDDKELYPSDTLITKIRLLGG